MVFCHISGDTFHNTLLLVGFLMLVTSKPIPIQLACGSQQLLGHQPHEFGAKGQPTMSAQTVPVPGTPSGSQQLPACSPYT